MIDPVHLPDLAAVRGKACSDCAILSVIFQIEQRTSTERRPVYWCITELNQRRASNLTCRPCPSRCIQRDSLCHPKPFAPRSSHPSPPSHGIRSQDGRVRFDSLARGQSAKYTAKTCGAPGSHPLKQLAFTAPCASSNVLKRQWVGTSFCSFPVCPWSVRLEADFRHADRRFSESAINTRRTSLLISRPELPAIPQKP